MRQIRRSPRVAHDIAVSLVRHKFTRANNVLVWSLRVTCVLVFLLPLIIMFPSKIDTAVAVRIKSAPRCRTQDEPRTGLMCIFPFAQFIAFAAEMANKSFDPP